jgi:ribosomal protein S18 acetylase RimI-like enzyme
VGELLPFPADRGPVLELLRAALDARQVPGEDPAEVAPVLEELVRLPAPPGRLYRGADGAEGLVLWQPATPIGVALGLVHLRAPRATSAEYRELLRCATEMVGPIPFIPGPLAGLSSAEEEALLRSLGYARFGRLEMRRPLDRPLPAGVPSPGRTVRSARPEDEATLARLHARAYAGRFDRYLFLSDADPLRDAALAVRDTVGGDLGEFLGDVSTVVEEGFVAVGACLVVRRPYGPLIVDVMTDPAHQGRGVGRAALLATLERLRDRGEPTAVLNVTVGNGPAVRLYTALGFATSIGPSVDWYHTGLVPVAPGDGYASPTARSAPRSPVE